MILMIGSPNRSQKALTSRQAGLLIMLFAVFSSGAHGQTPNSNLKRYAQDGLAFDYAAAWELSDQSNPAAQQLVLTEKTLDAQIMIVALRGALTSPRQEDQAKAALIEPSISRLLKQYEDAAIKVERTTATTDVAGSPAEGVQLRFAVDGQPGATDIYWRVINQRLVQLFFIRPVKTESKTEVCWDMVRSSLKIEKPAAKSKDHR
jgi:hypothetical protein